MNEVNLRTAVGADALCLSVLAMQVFLDTCATEGIRPAIARAVLGANAIDAFSAAIADASRFMRGVARSTAARPASSWRVSRMRTG
ncbi:MAG: hypothetical protein M3Y32_01830 [Pseudomonadota bacterium]|nr:hypothetical protein [Pseudomonadota bacterium]